MNDNKHEFRLIKKIVKAINYYSDIFISLIFKMVFEMVKAAGLIIAIFIVLLAFDIVFSCFIDKEPVIGIWMKKFGL